MAILIILGVVVLLAVGIIGFLFYMLRQEATNASTGGSEIQKSSIIPPQPKEHTPLEVPADPDFAALRPPPEDLMSQAFAGKEAVWQKKVDDLEQELKRISDEAQLQSSEALRTAEELKKENEQLRKEKEHYQSSNESLVKAEETISIMRQEQGALQVRLSESQQYAVKLQEEVVSLRQQMTQELLQEKTEVAKLVVENQKLQSSLEATSPLAIKELEDQIHVLKGQLLQNQDEIERLKAENQQLQSSLVSPADAVIDSGLQEKVDALNQELLASQAQCEQMKADMESLSQQNTGLITAREELDSNNRSLKDLNDQLNEKAELMQLELTKARAQVTSFERASENYKVQLKDALAQIEILKNQKSEELSKDHL